MKQMFEQSEESRAAMSIEMIKMTNDKDHLMKEHESLRGNMEKVSQKAGNLAVVNANLQSKLDEAQSKIQSLQQEVISIQVG
jgi:early endosome antigen 1